MLRPLYHRLLERYHGGRGIPLSLGPAGTIHVPATFVHNVIDPLELPMIEVLLPATSPRTCFYDIGASVGLHSLAVGERLDSAGEIHAFEPDLGSALQYWSNTRLLRRRGVPMQLHRCFVAERSRDFDPQRTRTHFTDAELARPGDPMRHLYLADTASAASHPFVALDDYVAAGMRPPSLVKCDIEGAELLFLRGATRVLRECRPLLFLSVHPALLPAFGHTVEDVRSTLSAAGYGWEVIDQEGEIHVRAEPAGA
jgi:FkbM family methyltransferase